MAKRDWPPVRDEILETVFYAFDEAQVSQSTDLKNDGLLDSLALVMIVEILADSSDRDDVISLVSPADVSSLARVEAFYETL